MSPEAYRDKIVSRLAQLGLDLRPVESISGHPGEFPRCPHTANRRRKSNRKGWIMGKTYWRDIDDIKRGNTDIGHHFFDADALRYFSSRIGRSVWNIDGALGWAMFVTSEQFKGLGVFPDGPRLYTVRIVEPDGQVGTASGFQDFATASEARAWARRMAGDLDSLRLYWRDSGSLIHALMSGRLPG